MKWVICVFLILMIIIVGCGNIDTPKDSGEEQPDEIQSTPVSIEEDEDFGGSTGFAEEE